MKRPIVVIALAASLLPLLAAAQGTAPAVIWRCGADGRSYSDTPCADGSPRGTVQLAAARPQADVDDAFARARREQQLADRLRAERLKAEADERKALAAAAKHRVKAAKPAASQAAEGRHPPRRQARRPTADDGIFRAVAPATRPAKG